MMGERTVMQEALFYGFSLERHVPDDHLRERQLLGFRSYAVNDHYWADSVEKRGLEVALTV